MLIRELSPRDLHEYEKVSIAFECRSRLDLDALSLGEFIELPVLSWCKDYDACPGDRPTAQADRFDTRNWLLLGAFTGDQQVGGAIVARDTIGVHMLEARSDLASVFDFRVDVPYRGRGVGRALFDYVVEWAKRAGCRELTVETQDINVAACRFYRQMGCWLGSIEDGAYGPNYDEARLIWRLDLADQSSTREK